MGEQDVHGRAPGRSGHRSGFAAVLLVACGVLAGPALSGSVAPASGDPTCREDARELVRVLSRNYAGWDDAVARLGADSIGSAERSLISHAGSASGAACDRTLREFLAVFQDDHLQLASDHAEERADEERPEPIFE
ncbi:MAG: hypothetical protein R3324_09230 [Halobacteriales archaeon]|nr:hypothetical protein [Halobacteriales archaeon]